MGAASVNPRCRAFAAIGLMLAAVGCAPAAPSAGTPCDLDRDCPAGQFCAPGGCTARADSGGAPDAAAPATDADVGCGSDAACDDHLFCNGPERCQLRRCTAGTAPCSAAACDESADRCNTTPADADGDGDPAATDCDDSNPARFHGNLAESNRCDDIDNDCDPSTLGPDGDGDHASLVGCCNPQADGSMQCGTDCDDTRPTINTSAVESCNTFDDDCDGHTDEDVLETYYADDDGDGYGRTSAPMQACDRPARHALLPGDCDDMDAGVNPGLGETCNHADDDCDMRVDEGAQITLYPDRDGDTYGADTMGVLGCPHTLGAVEIGGDCNDAASTIHPGVADATCDEIDQDCDLSIDENAGGARCYADTDRDNYAATGAAVIALCGSLSCPTGYTSQRPDPVAGTADCNPTVASIHPLAAEVCNGVNDDCDASIDEGLTRSTTCYRDTDGDGWGTTSTAVMCACTMGWSTMSGDCLDTDPLVSPGASTHTTPHPTRGWDWNCNGVDELGSTDVRGSALCESGVIGGCNIGSGWAGSVPPACGVSATYIDCSRYITSCRETTSTFVQGCR